MEENEFRDALRTVLTQSPEPPPMESSTALAAGRRAARGRTVMACTGAVAALAAVIVVPAHYLSGGSSPASIPVAGPAATPSAIAPPPSGATPDPQDTKPSWPAEASGDATADSGPRYQAGKELLSTLVKVVPGGYGTPTGTAPDGAEFQSHQAAIENPEWSYLASVKITKGGAAGQLHVEVHEPDNTLPKDPCALALSFWSIGGRCDVVQVGGAKVGVVEPTGQEKRLDQWAAYRYSDGTVVFVAQVKQSIFAEPPLTALPFTARELAGLAADQRFHVGV